NRPALDDQRADILRAFPPAKTLLGFVCRMNREPIRSPARSVANLEFHHTGDHVNEVARQVVAALERQGVRALNPAMGFPMEQDRFPGRIWVVSHKPVAVAAGLGRMGIHRNVIHPRFGNFVLLGTVLIDAEATASLWQSLAFGPNYKAAYCLAVCPAGEDVIAPFLTDRKTFLKDTVRPLTEKEETVYVIPGSDAEEYASRRFPKKKVKRVGSG